MKLEDAVRDLNAAARVGAARGSLIFHLDLATVLADRALAGQGIGAAALAPVADAGGYQVIAFGEGRDPGALARVSFDRAGGPVVTQAPRDVPAEAADVAQARRTIVERYPAAAAVVISAPGGPGFEAYSLAVDPASDRVAPDAHVLLSVSRDGRRLLGATALRASDAPLPSSPAALRDATLVASGAVPNEIHTYLSLLHGVPLVVETAESGLRWRVDGERSVILHG